MRSPLSILPGDAYRVLTMQRLTGVPLTDLNSIRSITSKDPEAVLIAALNTWFASVLGAETFHADVHAGNVSWCMLHVIVACGVSAGMMLSCSNPHWMDMCPGHAMHAAPGI